jgi:hypothetical protein
MGLMFYASVSAGSEESMTIPKALYVNVFGQVSTTRSLPREGIHTKRASRADDAGHEGKPIRPIT